MIIYCARCKDALTPIVADVIWKGESLCWSCMYDRNNTVPDESKGTVDWSDDFVSEILTLLDRIEIKGDAELASQRHDIAEKYGMTVVLGKQTSGFDN